MLIRRDDPIGVSAVMPLRTSLAGGSGSFLLLADDDQRYWCKTLNNFQGERVPITEQIVARLATLIGAPACACTLVDVSALAGWEFKQGSGRLIEPGWAHGSLAVDPAIETRALDHRNDDDNRRRHAGIHALCDWLAGGDLQWLRAVDQENAYYSHDHGFYLTGPAWTEATLAAARDAPFASSLATERLDRDELGRLAGALEAITRQEIESELSKLPAEWPVSDQELEAVVDFALARREPVATRLRGLVA